MLSAVAAAIHIELQPTARDQKLTQEMVEKERRLDDIYIYTVICIHVYTVHT